MKKPRVPPGRDVVFRKAVEDNRFSEVFQKVTSPFVKGEYLHWDKL